MASIKKCCCCFDLKVGIQVYSVLTLLISFPCLIVFIIKTASLEDDGISSSIFKTYSILGIVELLTRIVSCILLYVGTVKLNRHFLLPFLVIQMMDIVAKALCLVIILCLIGQIHELVVLAVALVVGICLAIDIYFWLVVQALYKQLSQIPIVKTWTAQPMDKPFEAV